MGRGRRGRRLPKLGPLLPAHKWESFTNSYMEQCLAGTSDHDIADKLSRGYFGQKRIGPAELRNQVEQIFTAERGGASFRSWFAARQQGDTRGSAIVAEAVVGEDKPDSSVVRLGEVERERDSLVARLRDLNVKFARQEKLLIERSAKPTDDPDYRDRLDIIKERNSALTKRSEAELASRAALERAEKAEAEIAVLRRRPASDERRLAEMQTTHDSLSGQITRLQIKLAEMTRDRDEKDVALRGALARASTAEAKRGARVIQMQPPQTDSVADDFGAFLDECVRRNVMTAEEAYRRLRRGA